MTNNKDSTVTDTDIFFANDYKAAKARASKYTLLEYARTVESSSTRSHIQMKKREREKERAKHRQKENEEIKRKKFERIGLR